MPAAAQPKGIPELAVALLKLMLVLLQPVEDVSVTAVEHSFCAEALKKEKAFAKQNIVTN